MDNFDSYNVLLAIAINIPVLLITAFGLQGHIASCCCDAPSVIVKAPCYFLKTMILLLKCECLLTANLNRILWIHLYVMLLCVCVCVCVGLESSTIKMLWSSVTVITPGCVPRGASSCPSWTPRLESLKATATFGWRRDTGVQVQHQPNALFPSQSVLLVLTYDFYLRYCTGTAVHISCSALEEEEKSSPSRRPCSGFPSTQNWYLLYIYSLFVKLNMMYFLQWLSLPVLVFKSMTQCLIHKFLKPLNRFYTIYYIASFYIVNVLVTYILLVIFLDEHLLDWNNLGLIEYPCIIILEKSC